MVQDNQNKIKKYSYWLLQKSTIQVAGDVRSIQCNSDASILVLGFKDSIMKIYYFQNQQLYVTQQHNGSPCIDQVVFMKKDTQLLLGHGSGIGILERKIENQWAQTSRYCIPRFMRLAEGFITMVGLIINSNQDQIITANLVVDETLIICWKQSHDNQQKISIEQEIIIKDRVFCLILNDLNTKLISAHEKKLICVFENNGSQWQIAQQIDVEKYGYRVCFINESEFVFLPYCGEYLHLYSFNNPKKLCEKVNQFKIKNGEQDCIGFPIQFIKRYDLLIVKNSNFVNILRIQENNTFHLLQSIEFKSFKIKGCVSDDGQYLLTYEETDKVIQVRKLMMIQ